MLAATHASPTLERRKGITEHEAGARQRTRRGLVARVAAHGWGAGEVDSAAGGRRAAGAAYPGRPARHPPENHRRGERIIPLTNFNALKGREALFVQGNATGATGLDGISSIGGNNRSGGGGAVQRHEPAGWRLRRLLGVAPASVTGVQGVADAPGPGPTGGTAGVGGRAAAASAWSVARPTTTAFTASRRTTISRLGLRGPRSSE